MMEIPTELIHLYKHWHKHTNRPNTLPLPINKTVLRNIELFATERMRIWERKQLDTPFLTDDPILSKYRFCNIYRELDKQTILLHTKLQHTLSDPYVWFLNTLFYRFIARPETIDQIGLLSFDASDNMRVYEKLMALSSPKYGTPYVFPVSVIQRSNWPTRESFFCMYLPMIAKQCVAYLLSGKNRSVCDAVKGLVPLFGFNFKFHLTEAVIDFAYQYPQHIDLFGMFPIGPGSLPTMQTLSNMNPEVVCHSLTGTLLKDFPYLTFNNKPVYLSAENWEGIGCEYRKYTHLKNGHGRKRIYKK